MRPCPAPLTTSSTALTADQFQPRQLEESAHFGTVTCDGVDSQGLAGAMDLRRPFPGLWCGVSRIVGVRKTSWPQRILAEFEQPAYKPRSRGLLRSEPVTVFRRVGEGVPCIILYPLFVCLEPPPRCPPPESPQMRPASQMRDSGFPPRGQAT